MCAAWGARDEISSFFSRGAAKQRGIRSDGCAKGIEPTDVWISLTVTATCDWTLTRKDGRTVWHQTIVTPYEAKFKEAFAAYVRLQRANEGAIRENFCKGIAELPAARF